MVLSDLLEAKALISNLESHNIDCYMIEKKDSSYVTLYTEFEIYVVSGQEHLARIIIENK